MSIPGSIEPPRLADGVGIDDSTSRLIAPGVSHEQGDRGRPDEDSWGLLTNHGPDYDFADPDSDWLFTLSLDFAF